MKRYYWFLLCLSAFLYPLPFLFTQHFWWLIFFFPIPLLYITRTENLSFIHGYVWGVITFSLHLSGGIYVIACMARESCLVGVLIGVIMILYQALSVALLFWCATLIARFFVLKSPIIRLCLWTAALALFIMWTDGYCLSIFGIKEGYPLMHPLIPLAQCSQLLLLLPILGKSLLPLLFLLFPACCVALLWFKNGKALLVWAVVCIPWIVSWCSTAPKMQKPPWLAQIKTISYMAYSRVANPVAMMKVAGNELKKVIAQYPETTIIIMPESAFNCSVLAHQAELLSLWNEHCLGKAVHLIFGSFRQHKGDYCNTALWVYNGELQQCFDKRHAMLVTERLTWMMKFPVLQRAYFDNTSETTIACNDRPILRINNDFSCIPYICSELFFNEYPDDIHGDLPIVVLVNDTSFLRPYALYIQNLLLLVACVKAIIWQRDILYVSYTRSVFINKRGVIVEIND